MGEPRQPLHLPAYELRVAPLPAVGEDHNDGAARHAAPPITVVELLQRVSDPRPAGPVRGCGRGALNRPLGVSGCQRTGDARQPGREDECLHAPPAGHRRGQELQVGPRVGLHRSRDVAEHHQPAGHDPPAPARDAHRVAAAAKAPAQGAAQIDPPAVVGALEPAGAPLRRRELELRHQPVEARELVGVEDVEALLREHLLVARDRARDVDRSRVLLPLRAARRRARDVGPPPLRPRLGGSGRAIRARALVERRGLGPGLVGRRALGGHLTGAEDLPEDRVEGGSMEAVGHEHGAGGPVEAPPAHRPRQGQRPREARGALRRHRDARGAQPLAEDAGERRQVEVDRLDAESLLSHCSTPASRGPPRGPPPGRPRT